MKQKQSRRDVVWPIFVGFIVVLLIGILASVFVAMIYVPSPLLSLFLNFFSPVIGGVIVGRMIKEKGWWYGGVLGVLLQAASIVISSLTFIIPMQGGDVGRDLGYQLAFTHILNLLLEAPRTIVLAAVGGYIGQYSAQHT